MENGNQTAAVQDCAPVQERRATIEPPVIALTEVEASEFDALVLDDLEHFGGLAESRRLEIVREVLASGLLAARRARGLG